MRKRKTSDGLTVNAIAGTHVVFLGLDMTDAKRKGCLGFAVQRVDHTEDEKYWMTGSKTFDETDPGLGPGGQISSHEHPYQTFQWSDYSAKPDHDYTYNVIPLFGTPKNLTDGTTVDVRIQTEKEIDGAHSIFFNRGAVASQEYARRFLNKRPDQLTGDEQKVAYNWLSRGLLEAFVAFVGQAKNSTFSLHAAIYEFQWPAALEAFKAASDAGADVNVLYDGIPGTGPKAKNEAAIAAEHCKSFCKARKVGKIMHNKFVVLSKNDKPIAVWTGSTNLTENGIFGHLNLGHAIEDATLAKAYLDYWEELSGNPDSSDERDWMADNNAAPPDPFTNDTIAIFSPRSGLKVLQWYADVSAMAGKALFMTFAFGMHKDFQKVYETDDDILRFALMEKEGNGSALAQGKIDIRRIRKRENVIVAVGNNIAINSFDRWLAERRQLTADANVRYIHTKYMLVDPLGDKPIVITGSANFSEASTNANNENMLVVRNDKRVADIYFGEFMRLFSHYAFREAVKIAKENGETDFQPSHLDPKDTWQKDYFTDGNSRSIRRVYFSGG